jgi:hypothetical protein
MVGSPPEPSVAGQGRTGSPALLSVMTSNMVLADLVANGGGDAVQVEALVPRGTDSHTRDGLEIGVGIHASGRGWKPNDEEPCQSIITQSGTSTGLFPSMADNRVLVPA